MLGSILIHWFFIFLVMSVLDDGCCNRNLIWLAKATTSRMRIRCGDQRRDFRKTSTTKNDLLSIKIEVQVSIAHILFIVIHFNLQIITLIQTHLVHIKLHMHSNWLKAILKHLICSNILFNPALASTQRPLKTFSYTNRQQLPQGSSLV